MIMYFPLQMLPYLTMHFPLTFSEIQSFVSHIIGGKTLKFVLICTSVIPALLRQQCS